MRRSTEDPTQEDVRAALDFLRSESASFIQISQVEKELWRQKLREVKDPGILGRFEKATAAFAALPEDSDSQVDPDLKRYYRMAARHSHPDAISSEERVGFFLAVTKAYEDQDKWLLQALVLLEFADSYNSLSEGERRFLLEEYSTIGSVTKSIGERTDMRFANVLAVDLMSRQSFEWDLLPSLVNKWELAVQRAGKIEEMQEGPRLIEGK